MILRQTKLANRVRRAPAIAALLAVFSLGEPSRMAVGAVPISGVQVEIGMISVRDGSFHWKITNRSELEIYVYDVFLLGPAYAIERRPGVVRFDTTPISPIASCPPNRFLPVLLMVIRSGGSIEGEFADPHIRRLAPGTLVSMRIAVGSEPNSVTTEWQRFLNSDCMHSPYDAIVRWATIVESNRRPT